MTGEFVVSLLFAHMLIPAEAGKQLANATIGGVLYPEVRRAHPVRYWSYLAMPGLVVAWVFGNLFTALAALS